MKSAQILGLLALTSLWPIGPGYTQEPAEWAVSASPGISAVQYDSFFHATDYGPALQLRAQWGVDRFFTPGIDIEWHHFNDTGPNPGQTLDDFPNRPPVVTRTLLVLLSLQLNLSRHWYMRSGVGLGRHEFPVFVNGAERRVLDTSSEWGIALGAAAGYRHQVSNNVGLYIEGVLRASSGEDSTSERAIWGLFFGVQILL